MASFEDDPSPYLAFRSRSGMSKALVTGGAGFIGSHVVDRFIRAGYETEVVDNLSSGRRANVNTPAVLHELDIRAPETARLVQDGAFDVVVHLAAQVEVRKS